MGNIVICLEELEDKRDCDENDRPGYCRSRRIECFAYCFEAQVQSSVVNQFKYDFRSRFATRLRWPTWYCDPNPQAKLSYFPVRHEITTAIPTRPLSITKPFTTSYS